MKPRLDIYEVIWRYKFVEKLADKHQVSTDEVEAVLMGSPFVRFWEKGQTVGEDLYVAYGQTNAGRYLVVFFILKPQHMALPISARDMTNSERRYYNGQKAR
ncbi:MAG: BrnT family toxin [Abitibacteriaceae bacterium]|nr:BrnT family toxin [Abditibacteriaceae bacterium]